MPNRSAWWIDANHTEVRTRMLLGLGADGDEARKTTVDDVIVVGGTSGVREPPVIRDITASFR